MTAAIKMHVKKAIPFWFCPAKIKAKKERSLKLCLKKLK